MLSKGLHPAALVSKFCESVCVKEREGGGVGKTEGRRGKGESKERTLISYQHLASPGSTSF